MAFDGSAWDETTPTDSNLANEIDDNMRDMKTGVSGRMAHEHLWPSSQSATNEAGLHRYLTLAEQTAAPALVVGTNTQQGAIYVNTVGSLVFVNSASNETVLVAGSTDTGSLLPAGAIQMYGGTSSPTGWILCTGGAISRTTYARLFSVLGTIYGTGDGTTTFNVPDMRGKFPVGKAAAGTFATLGTSGGSTTVNIEHQHNVPIRVGGDPSPFYLDQTEYGTGDNFSANYSYALGADATSATVAGMLTSTGGSTTQDITPPFVTFNYIIKD